MNVNTIYHGDCFKVLSDFKDDCVDFVLTSPPYNLSISIRPKGDIKKGKSRIAKVYKAHDDDLNEEEYKEFLYNIINELLRVTKNQVFFNIQYLARTKSTIFQLLADYKNQIKDLLIWHKTTIHPAMNKNVLTHNYEFIIVLDKNNNSRKYNKEFSREGRERTCFSEENNCMINKERFDCKGNFAVMSIQAARRIINTFTNKGTIVLDPFMGSGTTAVACVETGRNFVGVEKDEKFVKIAMERLSYQEKVVSLF